MWISWVICLRKIKVRNKLDGSLKGIAECRISDEGSICERFQKGNQVSFIPRAELECQEVGVFIFYTMAPLAVAVNHLLQGLEAAIMHIWRS